jgi:hypothetical protein
VLCREPFHAITPAPGRTARRRVRASARARRKELASRPGPWVTYALYDASSVRSAGALRSGRGKRQMVVIDYLFGPPNSIGMRSPRLNFVRVFVVEILIL